MLAVLPRVPISSTYKYVMHKMEFQGWESAWAVHVGERLHASMFSLQPPVELEGVGRCVAFSWSCTQFASIEVLQVTIELGHTLTGMPLIP